MDSQMILTDGKADALLCLEKVSKILNLKKRGSNFKEEGSNKKNITENCNRKEVL